MQEEQQWTEYGCIMVFMPQNFVRGALNAVYMPNSYNCVNASNVMVKKSPNIHLVNNTILRNKAFI